MTIEQLLTDLISAIDANTLALRAQKAPFSPPLPASIPALDKTVTAEDLQAMCTTIVRNDRTKKPQIVAALAAYDNAKIISDIPAKHYSAIKAKLEAISEH
jgi:hypothetical protein